MARNTALIIKTGPQLNGEIERLGKEIFTLLGKESPSLFKKNFWASKLMEWSMTKPGLKENLFRLVDVLPALESSESIAEHVREYLGDVSLDLPLKLEGMFQWGINAPKRSLREKLVGFAVRKGVSEMAAQFIAGSSPKSGLKELKRIRKEGLAFTVDLLGEYSVSEKEALHYLDRYLECLEVFGDNVPRWQEGKPHVAGHPGELSPVCISVKLTALYSQCSVLNFDRSVEVLSERLAIIARKAREKGALLYVDAEDTANNPLILRTFQEVFGDSEFRDFPYPGIVLQGYAKDSPQTVHELLKFAKERGKPIAIRLVKGAYWDHETVTAKYYGWRSPLFERKETTDANYEYLSRFLLDHVEHFLPAFGSHNIRSLSHACAYAESQGIKKDQFELQMLYGMAEPIARAYEKKGYLVRLYVPLGELIPGMGYLVRRLLENTSNESFLKHTFFDEKEIDSLLKEPQGVDFEAPAAQQKVPSYAP